MSEQKHGTAISWTHAEGFKGETWNPVVGCSKVSPGCANCYAETLSLRFGWTPKPWTPENAKDNVILKPERLDQPLRWRKPRMIFVNSMSDLFHEEVPDSFIEQVFVVMARAPQHTFQVLTKRPERALALLGDPGTRNFVVNRATSENTGQARERGYVGTVEGAQPEWPLPNVWLGVSIENARFTWRADVLREVPAAVRFISAEPLLGSLYQERVLPRTPGRVTDELDALEGGVRPSAGRAPLDLTDIDWVIVGGESGGRDSRPMHPAWAREIRDDAISRGIAFHFKQWGSYAPDGFVSGLDFGDLEGALWIDGAPFYWGVTYYRGAAPKSGGKLLDGVEWCEFPRAVEGALA